MIYSKIWVFQNDFCLGFVVAIAINNTGLLCMIQVGSAGQRSKPVQLIHINSIDMITPFKKLDTDFNNIPVIEFVDVFLDKRQGIIQRIGRTIWSMGCQGFNNISYTNNLYLL